MGIYFANGRSILPSNSWNITVNNTGGNLLANSYYFSIQARNRVGLTLPLYSSLITVNNNNSITITINSTAKETGEEWLSYIISANTTSTPLSFCQIAEIPLINLNDNSVNSFPLTINLINQDQLKLNEIVINNTLLPTTTAIHGMLRGLNSTGLIYKYDIFDTTTSADNLYVFNGINGKWKATGKFTTYLPSTTGTDGCSQDIRDITDPSSIIVPKYNPNGSTSNSITLWLTSTKIVKAGTRISVTVKLGELNKSQLFSNKLELKFKGFVNTTTGIKRTTKTNGITPLNEIDVLYKYDANNPTLILEDDLNVGEAYILEINCNFQSAEIEDYVVNGSYISIYPEFTSSASIYNPAGVIIGDVIFNDKDKRRIVSNLGLTAIALEGSGLIKNFSFPVQETTTITALQPNTTNIVAINKLGNCYVTNSLPSDAVQRAIVKTISGESNPSVWSSNVSVSANGSLSITVNYPCSTDGYGTVRSDYPDVIANNNKGLFNVPFINIYVDNGTVIKKFTNNVVIPNTNQTFTITDYSIGVTSSLPVNTDNTFSLFAPSTVSVTANTGGNFSTGSYKVCYSFVYNGSQITSITHKESDGCVSELTFNLLEALQRFKYVWLNGSGVPNNFLGYNDNYYLDNDTKNYYNKINNVWVLIGNLRGSTWLNGTINPTASDGNTLDYYINTTTYDYFKKTSSTVWTNLGNLKGAIWYSTTGTPTDSANVSIATSAKIYDLWLNSSNGDYYVKTTLPNTWILIGNLKGSNGATWYNGTGVPSNSLGSINDYYLNNSTSDYYQKTGTSTWTLLGTFKGLTGNTGATGATGNPGSQIYTGNGVPSNSLGVDTDFYLNTATSDYYKKSSSVWSLQGNLKGLQGNTGATGQAGATWITGSSNPTSGQGSINDLYLNTTTYDYYLKTNSTTWTLQGNLKGTTGSTGATGTLSSNSGLITDNNTVSPTTTATQIAIYSKSGIATIVNNSGTENTIAYVDKFQTYTKAQGSALISLTDTSTITVDASLGNTFKVTLAGNRTLANCTNAIAGFTYIFIIVQDSTGNRTLTFDTYYKFTSTPTLTTTANKVDIVSCVYDGTYMYCNLNKGW